MLVAYKSVDTGKLVTLDNYVLLVSNNHTLTYEVDTLHGDSVLTYSTVVVTDEHTACECSTEVCITLDGDRLLELVL